MKKSWLERYIKLRIVEKKNGKSFKVVSNTKKITDEDIECNNLIQDWVFTTVYRLENSGLKNACKPFKWC